MKFNSHYPYPPHILLRALVDVVRAKPTSLARLAQSLVAGINPSPHFWDADNIPTREPFILVFNHYGASASTRGGDRW